jgi:hypothetical protein
MTRATKKDYQDRLSAFRKKQELDQFEEAISRARSVTVGTAFGGTLEIGMRRLDGVHVFALLQPVEAIELVHQIAAAVGCHIALKPREDFSSWRQWNESGVNSAVGWAPMVENSDEAGRIASQLPEPDAQPGVAASLSEDGENGETMATEAPKQRRKSERTAASS